MASIFLLGILACELGARGLLALRGKPYDADRVEQRLQDSLGSIAAIVPRIGRQAAHDKDGKPLGILHPFTGSEREHDSGGVLAYFRAGVPESAYTVLVVGGSVASDFARSAGGELERILARDPRFAGRTVRVLDYAHAAYKEPQQLTRLVYLFSLGYRPQAVINIDGYDELAAAYQNATQGTNPLYPSPSIWAALVQDFGSLDPQELDLTLELRRVRNRARDLVEGALESGVYRSCLAGWFVEERLNGLIEERREVQAWLDHRMTQRAELPAVNRQRDGADYEHGPQHVFATCVENWFESSLSIEALCRARKIAYLHVLQPTLHDAGSKTLSDAERALTSAPSLNRSAVSLGYPMLRARSPELERRGVHFLDASQAFAGESATLYLDDSRFAPRGSQILARAIAPYFLGHVWTRTVVAEPREAPPQGEAR